MPGWADYSSDEESLASDTGSVAIEPGTGYQFNQPLVIGPYTLNCVGDFRAHILQLQAIWHQVHDDELATEMWADFVNDIVYTVDEEEIEAALRDLRVWIRNDVLTFTEDMAFTTGPLVQSTAELAFNAEGTAELQKAVDELGIDTAVIDTKNTDVYYNKVDTSGAWPINQKGRFKTPPLCPVGPNSMPTILRFNSMSSKPYLDLDDRCRWDDELRSMLGDDVPDSGSSFVDDSTYRTSKSNTRPLKYPSIVLVYDDGYEMNIGSHDYKNLNPVDISLDFSDTDIALQELFSAPGGEGLTTPTPSHMLHQMISAVYSASIKHYHVEVEVANADITIHNVAWADGTCHDMFLDITSSANIHNKTLSPTANNPEYRTQGAVSKYDMASALRHISPDRARTCIFKSVCLSLSCEYPDFFRKEVDCESEDLELQAKIFDTLTAMSTRNMQKLGHLSYTAALCECVDLVSKTDLKAQGKSFADKKQVLIDKIDSLSPRNAIAFPPIPLSSITGFKAQTDQVEVSGHIFDIPDPTFEAKRLGPRYHMTSKDIVNTFLKNFPSSGLISHSDAINIASKLDANTLLLNGNVHKGPMPACPSVDPDIVDQVDSLYSQSAQAQFLEIRADLVRSIHQFPMPPDNSWNQVWIYLGKVCAFYRCRDAPNSAKGYRIDWFAVSTFEAAGSEPIALMSGSKAYLWPRQKIRSQEMDLIHMAPRRFKTVLFSMLEKAGPCSSSITEIYQAWERMLITTNTSTWASGVTFLTSRFLSSSLSSPSSPFDSMASKFVPPKTFADVFYLQRMRKVLEEWTSRDQYHDRSPILGLPRQMSQLESYWKDWVPNEFADANKNMAECVKDLFSEHQALVDTAEVRIRDLRAQWSLLQRSTITLHDLRSSLKASTSIDTDGRFGWSFVGSLAAAYALNLKSPVSQWDKNYAYGKHARTMVDHLTVRHSARIDHTGLIKKGTVAELMIDQGTDLYLSKVDQAYRFMFCNIPVFFNHPKKGESKNREISITDPDSRIFLSDAELVAGKYGSTTGVDYLKVSSKDSKFYSKAERVLLNGGAIQSSDAKRYGPMMSNYAIAIVMLYLGTFSMHFRWAAAIYARLAHRRMLLPLNIKPTLEAQARHSDTSELSLATLQWLSTLPKHSRDDETDYVSYCDSHHMGQGMSHHGSSLMHAGALIVTHNAAQHARILVHGKPFRLIDNIMVTSDDSTSIPEAVVDMPHGYSTRRERQIAAHTHLKIVRAARAVGLRMVSVIPNLAKEVIAGNKGEFNSNDSGIGSSSPMLGFRELVSLLVPPSSPSLIGDYMDAHANARTVALSGQGLSSANYFHAQKIDAIEERWKLTADDQETLKKMTIIPNQLLKGATGAELCSSPASWLDLKTRASLVQISIANNLHQEDIDPHVKDSVFGPCMHVRVSMSKQHRNAIGVIKAHSSKLKDEGMTHASQLLDDTLRATISSARTRNLGRVAARIRNRVVRPKDFFINGRVCDFDKGTMFERTMCWLAFLEDTVAIMNPGPNNIRTASEMAGFINVAHKSHYAYPNPPRRRRHIKPMAPKPRFSANGYGITPFGKHALSRGRITPVSEIGNVERDIMLRYFADQNYRSFTEHVEYGGMFVTSWIRKTAGKIVSIDLTREREPQEMESVRFGAYTPAAIQKLQDTQAEYPDHPVLALHRKVGYMATFHCIYRGESMTVELDTRNVNTDHAIVHQYQGRRTVLLATQGIDKAPTWTGSAPKKQELDNYIYGPPVFQGPDIASVLEHTIIKHQRVTVPTYSTEIEYEGEKVILYTSPDITQYPTAENQLIRHLPYLRSRVIAELAMGGYWHNNIRGVCFRSYLRGHFHGQTVWTGSTIGWHSSVTNLPIYNPTEINPSCVKGILVLNGLATCDELSGYNVNLFSSGYKVISHDTTVSYDRAIKLPPNLSGTIYNANGNNRHFITYNGNNTLDVAYSNRPEDAGMGSGDARRYLMDHLDGTLDQLVF